MLKLLDGNKVKFIETLKILLDKRKFSQQRDTGVVKKIILDIKNQGDTALIRYEKKFTKKKTITKRDLEFSKKEISKYISRLDKKVKKSIDLAFNRIKKFHLKQKLYNFSYKDNYNNSFLYRTKPIEKVGIYVPGGTANYPSSVLMNSIPALVAGVKNIYMTSPSINSKINPAVMYAAKKCGIKKIYKIGGAQAIASFAFGTETINKVDKIVGPGNTYVASAKKFVFGEVGIDMVAGPSEVTILADKFSNSSWIAADLIAQAEHDKLSQSILICNDKKKIEDIRNCVKQQVLTLPKKNIINSSLKNFGYSIFVKDTKMIIKIINEIAPEHLELNVKKPEKFLKRIDNAGSIFLGKYSPEAIGDYLAGPNHVLPTSGSAKFSSGLSVFDFLKRQSVIKITKTGIERLAASVINLSKYEKLEGHASSVELRIKRKGL